MFFNGHTTMRWLEQRRWGENWRDKKTCPHCGGCENISISESEPFTYRHKDCHHHFTVKTGIGTYLSKIKTRELAVAMHHILISPCRGVNSLKLAKKLKITQESAQFILQCIHETCIKEFKLPEFIVIKKADLVDRKGRPTGKPDKLMPTKETRTNAESRASAPDEHSRRMKSPGDYEQQKTVRHSTNNNDALMVCSFVVGLIVGYSSGKKQAMDRSRRIDR